MKRVLVVSPSPSHPQDAGNRSRIFRLSNLVMKFGCEIHFCHVERERGDNEEMVKFWDNYFIVPFEETYKSKIISAWNERISKLFPRLTITYGVDDWVSDNCLNKVKIAIQNTKYDIVIINYVFLSKILKLFGPDVLKIIDTHDRFGGRAKLFIDNNEIPSWFFTTEKQEKKGLNRSDVIFAIQEKEYNYYKKLTCKQVINIGHFSDCCSSMVAQTNNKTIMFIGSVNHINRHSLKILLEKIFPCVIRTIPEAKLLLAGKICSVVDEVPKGCFKIGVVKDLQEIYQKADVVVNPVFFGTGLKIKNIEALSFGKALITTKVGAQGIEEGVNDAFLVAETTEDFSNKIIYLLSNPSKIECLRQKAYEFVLEYNKNVVSKLESVII